MCSDELDSLLSDEERLLLRPGWSSKQFAAKPPDLRQLTNEALEVLCALGIPLEETPRRIERMALAFLAVLDVHHPDDWATAKTLSSGWALTTRQIIAYWNRHLGENVSSGSYDDIRRKDLLLPVHAGVIVPNQPDSARNNSQRGYALADEYGTAVRQYGRRGFRRAVADAILGKETLAKRWAADRARARIPIQVEPGLELSFGPGEHNMLIKAVIQRFLPRFGHDARVLYVGDAEDKNLHVNRDQLNALGFFDLAHGELPDVVAYSNSRNWLYVIEAVHSFGPISQVRRDRLRDLLAGTTAGVVFVTAFSDRASFRRWVKDIAWETEVWIASEPEHLIHFNGDRFLGPHDA
ncbi:MAG TPA: BsuBI/PstI family type II restriction endonuclease [Conexibacter sp.]|nr:BsuBI/PstI family type II restriction endonuclease [Conexibacter sp.]